MSNGITKGMLHLNGQDGVVEVSHTVYGNQKIYTTINFIDKADRVGICVGRQEIYLTMDEIKNVRILEDSAFIGGDLMQISIIRV